jgi:hypothetical protein
MPANPFDALLAQSRDLFCDRLGTAVHGMLDHANEVLTKLAEKTDDKEQQSLLIDARDKALAQRNVIEKQFRARYVTEFQKVVNRARKLGTSLADISLDQLELVGEDDLTETLKFKDMAAKLRRFCEEELGALDQRVGVLMGDAELESDNNPFGPQGIVDAYKQACRQVDDNVAVRLVLLKLFDDHVLDTIRSSYKAVNELLVQNGILPKIRYAVSKSESSARPPGEKAPDETGKMAAAKEPMSEGDVFSMIQKMLAPVMAKGGGPPAPGMGVGGVPIVEGQALMGSLTQLQVGDLSTVQAPDAETLAALVAAAKAGTANVLRDLKSTSVGAGMGQVDAMTLDVVAMLFDEIFEDPKVPIAVKGLIGRLQLPVLKVAIADKELFTKKTHPARQLIDALGKLGVRLPADFDGESPLFGKLERFITELVDGFQEKMEIFDEVRARLDEIIEEYDANVSIAMQESAKQLERAESLAVAKAAAQEQITALVQASPNAPRAILDFLSQQWIKYLLIAHAREGVESGSWKAGLETMQDLLWSVEPKATQEDRRKLASTIPSLLKRLRAGLAMAGVGPEQSTAFFGEMMKCHTDVMQAPPKEKERPKPSPSSSSKKPVPPPPPPSADDLLDFTAPVVVANPFGEGEVEVASQDLDFTPTPGGPALEAAAPSGDTQSKKPRDTVPLPMRMAVGAWVEIQDADGNRTPAMLHYVSPMKSHFLFVDRKGHKVFECSRTVLKRRLDNFEIAILDEEPDTSLFDRILGSLFGKLGKPVPA